MTAPREFELWIAPLGTPAPRRTAPLDEQGYELVAAADGAHLLTPARNRYPVRWLDGGRKLVELGRRYLVVAQTSVEHYGRRGRGVMTDAAFTDEHLVAYPDADGFAVHWHTAGPSIRRPDSPRETP